MDQPGLRAVLLFFLIVAGGAGLVAGGALPGQDPPGKTAKAKAKEKPEEPEKEPENETEPKEPDEAKESDEPADDAEEVDAGVPKPPPAASVEEQYVRDHLKSYLFPNGMDVLLDGRIRLVFDFHQKVEDQEMIFTPRLEKSVQSKFRWSIGREESYFRGYVDGTQWTVGLRIANQGKAHIDCWFTDDVEAEIQYIQATTFSATQNMALVFTNASGKSIGSNFGTQCATYVNGLQKSAKGRPEELPAFQPARFKLVLANGKFEAHRGGKPRAAMDYKPKDYASGRLGFIWNGGMAAYIYSLEVTGRVDVKKMAELIRKGRKG